MTLLASIRSALRAVLPGAGRGRRRVSRRPVVGMGTARTAAATDRTDRPEPWEAQVHAASRTANAADYRIERIWRYAPRSYIERRFAAEFFANDWQYARDPKFILDDCHLSCVRARCFEHRDTTVAAWRSRPERVWYLVPQVMFRHRERLDFVVALIAGDESFAMVGVECDGRFWHGDKARDQGRDLYLLATGLNVLRFSGSAISTQPGVCINQAKRRLIALVEGRP